MASAVFLCSCYLLQQGSQPSTLLDLAGSSALGSQAAASDPWGFPVQPSQPTDPWGSSLPGPDQVTADPWAPQDSAPGMNTQASGSSDPWGLPVSSPSPPSNTGKAISKKNLKPVVFKHVQS